MLSTYIERKTGVSLAESDARWLNEIVVRKGRSWSIVLVKPAGG